MKIRAIAIAAFVAAAALPVAAFAFSQEGTWVWGKWAASDRCSKGVFKQFPDYTADSNAKRDAAFQQCLASQNLPPRDLAAPDTKP